MSASTLVSLTLLFAPPAVGAAPPGVVDLDTGAWAVVHAGQLWVCWQRAADCWRRVEFESPPSGPAHTLEDVEGEINEDFLDDASATPLDGNPGRWRLGFWGPRSLWIELGEQRWRVDLGQQRARVTDDPAPLRLGRPRAHTCGPAGLKPAIVGGRLGWQSAHRCGLVHGERSCVAPALPRQRRPRALRLNVGLQLSSSQAWTSHDDHVAGLSVARVRATAGFEFAVVAEIGFDLGRASAHQRAQAALMRRDRVRRLPTLVSDSATLAPLASAEARALRAVLCGEAAR